MTSRGRKMTLGCPKNDTLFYLNQHKTLKKKNVGGKRFPRIQDLMDAYITIVDHEK